MEDNSNSINVTLERLKTQQIKIAKLIKTHKKELEEIEKMMKQQNSSKTGNE